jgi:mannose-6-phosphate isomerase
LLTYFEKIPVKPGDIIMVPGGFPHAIGEGIFMIEIMEPTDFCVRAEFERGGYLIPEENRFMNRGIDFALSMYNYELISKEEILQSYFFKPRRIKKYNTESWEEILIDESNTPCFRVKKLHIQGKIEKTEDIFYVGIIILGTVIITKDEERYEVKKDEKFLVPAFTKRIYFETMDTTEIILVFPPK